MDSDGQLLPVMNSVIDSDGECECNMFCVFVKFDPAFTFNFSWHGSLLLQC